MTERWRKGRMRGKDILSFPSNYWISKNDEHERNKNVFEELIHALRRGVETRDCAAMIIINSDGRGRDNSRWLEMLPSFWIAECRRWRRTIIRPESKLLARLLLLENVTYRGYNEHRNPSPRIPPTPEKRREILGYFSRIWNVNFAIRARCSFLLPPPLKFKYREIQSIARKRRMYYAFMFEILMKGRDSTKIKRFQVKDFERFPSLSPLRRKDSWERF